jgi:hypothetical protein
MMIGMNLKRIVLKQVIKYKCLSKADLDDTLKTIHIKLNKEVIL